MITLYSRDSVTDQRSTGQLVSLAKGSAVYHQGDSAAFWYEVASGIVRTCRFLSDGHRQLTGFFYSDEVFGVDASIYQESAEAVTNVVLRRYPTRADDDGDTVADARGKVLEKALESARRCIFLFGHRTAANRVAAFLISQAERCGAQAGLQLPMTRSDIADYLNLTLHTVSRTIADFARKRLIALDSPQHLRILDLDGLRALSGEPDAQDGFHVYPLSPREGLDLCEND